MLLCCIKCCFIKTKMKTINNAFFALSLVCVLFSIGSVINIATKQSRYKEVTRNLYGTPIQKPRAEVIRHENLYYKWGNKEFPLNLTRLILFIPQFIISIYLLIRRVNEVDLNLNDILCLKIISIIAIINTIVNIILTFTLFLIRIFTILADNDFGGYNNYDTTNFQGMSGLNIAFDIIIMISDIFCIIFSFLIFSNIIYCNGTNDKYFNDNNNQINIIRYNPHNNIQYLPNNNRLNTFNKTIENNVKSKKEIIMVDQNGEYFIGRSMGKNPNISADEKNRIIQIIKVDENNNSFNNDYDGGVNNINPF